MENYDARAVWQRVHATRENDDLEQALSESITFERRAEQAYRTLAKCSGNLLFSRLASQEAQHAKQLHSLYYLLFGCLPCHRRQETRKYRSLCEALQQAYQGELMARQRYEHMAESHPQHRALFCSLARREQTHACLLQKFAQQLF